MTQRKHLVYGGLKGLNSHIERLAKTGWRLVKFEIDYWPKGKRVYFAELEKG